MGEIYAVIMAGGRGERFWPESRRARPKQLLRLIGETSMLESTVHRLEGLVARDNIFIITNEAYVGTMRRLLAEMVPANNIVGEPVGRDTGPCVALAAALVEAKSNGDQGAVMVMLPSDHVIRDESTFRRQLKDCAAAAGALERVVTIGITPDEPSTAYGYIHCGGEIVTETSTTFLDGLGFKEKPDAARASQFLAEGCYKWNGGIFVWTLGVVVEALRRHAPDLDKLRSTLAEAVPRGDFAEKLAELYQDTEKISIDFAVMEKLSNVAVAVCEFDWDDVGSWTAMRNQLEPDADGNVVRGRHLGLDTRNSIIFGESEHLVATIDIEGMAVIHTADATLVCPAKSAQRIKEIVNAAAADPTMDKFL